MCVHISIGIDYLYSSWLVVGGSIKIYPFEAYVHSLKHMLQIRSLKRFTSS